LAAAFSKNQNIDFGVPSEIMGRTPAPELNRFIINGVEFDNTRILERVDGVSSKIVLYYRAEDQTYGSNGLSICPWGNSEEVSHFGDLAEALGGTLTTCRHEKETTEWTIGENTWTAKIKRIKYDSGEKEGEIKHILTEVAKNGEFLFEFNSNLYSYSIEELEQLLDVTITWENHETIAYITANRGSDTGNERY
jgi:hypothetical protein